MDTFATRQRIVLREKEWDYGKVIALYFDIISDSVSAGEPPARMKMTIMESVDGVRCGWFDQLAAAVEVGDDVPLKLIFGP